MKNKVVIFIIIMTFLILTCFIIFKFLINVIVYLNFGVSILPMNRRLYDYSEFGRDGDVYTVGKYRGKRLEKMKKLDWVSSLESDIYEDKLYEFLRNNNIPIEFVPVVDNDTLYFLKKFDDKHDYLLIIYNVKESMFYIYQYHI